MRMKRTFNLIIVLASVVATLFPGVGVAQTRSSPPRSEVVHYPDLILINGKIVTVDKNFSIQQAVAVRDVKQTPLPARNARGRCGS